MADKKVRSLILKVTALKTLVAFIFIPVFQNIWQRKDSAPEFLSEEEKFKGLNIFDASHFKFI